MKSYLGKTVIILGRATNLYFHVITVIPMPEGNWQSFISGGSDPTAEEGLTRRRRHLGRSPDRPRWSLAFDPVNQIVFWSDAVTGLIGAEDSREGSSIGLVANLTDVS